MKSVDITTLPNYETIPLGTHKLTVTAQADGYTDSDPSAEVTFINGYALTVQHDNCTYTPHSSMIAVFEDTVITFKANTGYNLPDTVTVTGASHTWDKSTGKLTITNVTGVVAVTVTATQPQLAAPTNVSVSGTTVLSWDAVENATSYDILVDGTSIGEYSRDDMPVKGDIIVIDSKKYRVMKINGTNALLMANYSIGTRSMYSTSTVTTVAFGSYTGTRYDGSDLDTYLNSTFFNSLSNALQSAIVSTNISQSMYYIKWGTTYSDFTAKTYDGNTYTGGRMGGISIQNPKKVYVLDVDDIVDYFGRSNIITAAMISDLLSFAVPMYNSTDYVNWTGWLRSATDISNYFRTITPFERDGGTLASLAYSGKAASDIVKQVFPAFQIDLSKINWNPW